MKKVFLLVAGCWILVTGALAQTVSQRVQKAFGQFEADSQLKHAISSLYVIDANTGEVVCDKNSQVGLAGASTQKIITAATAFELLGKDYKYRTELKYEEDVFLYDKGVAQKFFLYASGDPTLGSWRYNEKAQDIFFKQLFSMIADSIKTAKYHRVSTDFAVVASNFDNHSINDRWIWQDIGNYYGASHYAFNWRENQYDICFSQRDNEGDPVLSATTIPDHVHHDNLTTGIEINMDSLKTGKKGSGDNAYVYYVNENIATVKGTIPPGKSTFTISASHPKPEELFYNSFHHYNKKEAATVEVSYYLEEMYRGFGRTLGPPRPRNPKLVHTFYSLPIDSIVYWFLKKSINLYGEALIKTVAYEQQGFGSTDSGLAILRKFWKGNGLDEEELNMYDGSGLSPMNRITTHAQVEILKYARTRPWFQSFYYALPEYNGMKMKSGTIGDVKGFCGYHKAKDGKEYIFSFIVNNYSGRSSGLVSKMYKVLDELK